MSGSTSTPKQEDVTKFLQCSLVDPKEMASEYKFNRHGDFKKLANDALAPNASPDDLKKSKAGLRESITKGRERVKIFRFQDSVHPDYYSGLFMGSSMPLELGFSILNHILLVLGFITVVFVLLYINEGCDPVNKLYYCDISTLPGGIKGCREKNYPPFVKPIDNFDAMYQAVANDNIVFTSLRPLPSPRATSGLPYVFGLVHLLSSLPNK
ncbi:hypothetical protein Tco_1054893 [Tanacetum coccineum]|uniref:Uncharacterized protein n=1 Tax=Tanacetum coccineum TaxID=301880 RepID=A0ABQ5GY34_9ASTR